MKKVPRSSVSRFVRVRVRSYAAAAALLSCCAYAQEAEPKAGAGTVSSESDEAIAKSVARFEESVAKAETLLKSGDRAATREACKAALRAATLDKATPKWLAAADSVLWRLASQAYSAGDLRTAHDAWERVYQQREATLPEDHPALLGARQNLASTKAALGDLSGASTLQRQVLAVFSRTLPDEHPDLQTARLNLAITKRALGDLPGAMELQEKVVAMFSATLPDEHRDLQRAQLQLASTKRALGDLPRALALAENVFAVRTKTLPDDHLDLQTARSVLASIKSDLGDRKSALVLEENVVAVFSKSLPDDHPHLQAARGNLASTKRALGDLRGALALQEKVLDVYSRTLPDHHPDLQTARGNLAVTKKTLGDLSGALALEEKVFAVRSATLPDDHPDLQQTRNNLAVTKKTLGDLLGALALEEKVFAVRAATLPDDHPDLQQTRNNLGNTKAALGDLRGALALQEKALAVWSKTLPDEDPDLQAARGSLALTRRDLGDLSGALALQQKIFAVCSRTLPDDHSDLQAARGNLAATTRALGDLSGALAIQEKVFAVCSGTLPDDHPELHKARLNLANTKYALGDLSGALALQERVFAVWSQTLSDDHPSLQAARGNLALTKHALGDLSGASALQEKVLAVCSATLPDDHPRLQVARRNLALSKHAFGDLSGASVLQEKVLAVSSKTLSDDHPELHAVRLDLAKTTRALGDLRRAALLNRAGVAGALRRPLTQSVSSRDVAELARQAAEPLSQIQSLLDLGDRLPTETAMELRCDALQLLEAIRGGELHIARVRQVVRERHPATFARIAAQVAGASQELEHAISLPARGRTTPTRDDAIREATLVKDALEREVLALVPQNLRAAVTPAEFAAQLAPHEAAVSFLTYTRWTNDPEKPWITSSEQRYGAFVLAPSGEVSWYSLAPVDAIDALIASIRSGALEGQALATRSPASAELAPGRDPEPHPTKAPTLASRLTELRMLVFDPVLAALPEGTNSLVLSLTDELQLVPLDELLASGGAHGETFAMRSVWSLRALMERGAERTKEPTALVLGGADYDATPDDIAPVVPEAATPIVEARNAAETDRGDPGSGAFAPLPGTKVEAEALAAKFAKSFADRTAITLLAAGASEAAFAEQAPGKTFLHVATHGYFAPDDAWRATDATNQDQLARFDAGRNDRAAQLSPYSLAGIALTGANLPADELGRLEGILTAQEIVQLDLQHCFLATLSACKTSLGVRRAGTGLASLRQAFHAAGARYVLATLWEVNDAQAAKLMDDFYTQLWKNGLDPHTALRTAKVAAKERGAAFRDWAGWVLSGR